MNHKTVPSPGQVDDKRSIYHLAAGLLWFDKEQLLGRSPLIFAAPLFLVISTGTGLVSPGSLTYWAFYILERLGQLLFYGLVLKDWLNRLNATRSPNSYNWRRLIVFGFLMWSLYAIPLGVISASQNVFIAAASFFVLGISIWLSLRYFFYPLPAFSRTFSNKECLTAALEISSSDGMLPLKLIIAPTAITSLLTGLCLVLYPDGRSLFWVGLAEVSGAIFWILLAYLSLAASLHRISNSTWSRLKLDPFRDGRLSTLESASSNYVAKKLMPAQGMLVLGVSALIWGGNLVRMLNSAPAASITAKAASAEGDTVRIRLELSDSDYQFRGFSPFAFALAGEKRTVVANTPSKVLLNGEEVSGLSSLQRFRTSGETPELILEFKANRSNQELLALKDLWLWYNSVKIAHIALAASSGTP